MTRPMRPSTPRSAGRSPARPPQAASSPRAPQARPGSDHRRAQPERIQPLRSGQKITVTFRTMNAQGAAVGTAGPHHIAVPYAAPGEEAIVEIVRGGPRAEGKIVSLLRKSLLAQTPACRHFGVCGGCQWQHVSYDAQLQHKTALARQALASVLGGGGHLVHEAAGGDPWAYRNRLQAEVAMRGDRLVAGFHVSGGDLRIVNVRECPIQHAGNVQALDAARTVLAGLGWPVFDPETGRGLLRGLVVQASFATGEVMVVLSAAHELPDRMAFVRGMREGVPALRSLMLSVAPRSRAELLGRLELLWGRGHLEDEVAGVRVRVFPTAALPPNPRALPAWVDAVASALALQGTDTVLDAACEEGFMAVALAQRARKVIGIAADREAMHRAWDTASLNGLTTCVFYTRAPEGVVAKLRSRGEHLHAALLTSRGSAAPAALFEALRQAGTGRLAVAGSSLTLLAADLRTAAAAGYRVTAVRPVDLLPQTSRVHCVVSLVHEPST